MITVSPAIRQGQAIVVTYTDPTAGDDATAFQDVAGNDAASFTTGSDGVPAVTNASTVTNTPATGAPTITGTAQVGQTLTAGTTAIMDADGLTTPGYTYQWIRTAGRRGYRTSPGATASTYTLVAADLGTTIKVRVSFTDDASTAETLTSAATAAVAAAAAPTEVPAGWNLKPTGLAAGDQFRLVFLSSTTRDGSSTDIADYNTFVQGLAAAGHADIRAYSAGFRAVGCTADTDARDNTGTTYTSSDKGVPIYWLDGAKAADQYEDFYDGSWDEEANDKNESGTNGPDTSQSSNYPLTGCGDDGTEAFNSSNVSRALGASGAVVRVGRPNSSITDNGPINSIHNAASTDTRPMYGLSAVFQVAAATVPADWSLKPTSLTTGDKFRLLFLSSTKRDGSSTDIADLQHLRPGPRRGRPRRHPGLQRGLQGGRLHRRHRRPRQHLHHLHQPPTRASPSTGSTAPRPPTSTRISTTGPGTTRPTTRTSPAPTAPIPPS